MLAIAIYILLSRKSKTNNVSTTAITPAAGLEDILPGTIIPTTDITPGQLDIVAVSPTDRSANIIQTTPIEITFSQEVDPKDIEFSISPELTFTQKIEGNKLIITPTENFQTSTLYTYGINIISDKKKIRMYTFSTAGDEPIYRPDTGPNEEAIKKYDESVRIRYPDIYLKNNTPYETTTFGITGTYSEQKEYFEFKVLLKGANKNDARASFIVWLQTLDLTDQQIQSLDITYE